MECKYCRKAREYMALLTRFNVIEMGGYTMEQFINIAVEQLDVPVTFADFIAVSVWNKYGEKSNMRECERIAAMCHSEEDVEKYLEMA